MASLKYVREIDGMRAIAVLSVLLYHCGFVFVPGGFVGVDIFFVISGFLITRIIHADLTSGRFSFVDFYQKRIARIVPALYMAVLFAGALFFVLYPPAKSGMLLREVASALVSLSNVYFYENIDYFSDAASSPVLHTWSLAVEEQFYFALPIFLSLLFIRGRRWLIFAVAALAMASFVSAVVTTPVDRLAAFYLPWNRAWELMAGSLVALISPKGLSVQFRSVCIGAGILLMAVSVALITKKSIFPGVGAIAPVLGAMLCLFGAGAGGAFTALLSNRVSVFFGKISYSLYLVHWPIVCVALLFNVLGSLAVKVGVVLLSVGLAWLSWRFVEAPMRQRLVSCDGKSVFKGFALATLAMCGLLLGMQLVGETIWNRTPKAIELTSYMKNHGVDYRSGTCFLYPELPQSVKFDSSCLNIHQGGPAVLLIGDSHAANINDSLRASLQGMQILQATATGCKPVVNSQGDGRCVALNERVIGTWLPMHRNQIERVIIAARWDNADIPSLDATLTAIEKVGVPVVVVGPHPEYYAQYPLVLAYEELTGKSLADRFFRRSQWVLDANIREMIESRHSANVKYYSVLNRVCSDHVCTKQIDGAPLLSDRDHFTRVGADLAVKPLSQLLKPGA